MNSLNNLEAVLKNMRIEHNVSINVLDAKTHEVIQSHTGHNAATNSMLNGIAHYLVGSNISSMHGSVLDDFLPRYISLGTMGLLNQDSDENGLPSGIGVTDVRENYIISTQLPLDPDIPSNHRYAVYGEDTNGQYTVLIGTYRTLSEAEDVVSYGSEYNRFTDYMDQNPGYGSDGYALRRPSTNNGREYLGLGPMFPNRYYNGEDGRESKTINCELISTSFPRSEISYRNIIPEYQSEEPESLDIVFGAMISTGALAQFREPGRDYIFITEAGLWSRKTWDSTDTSSNNGLLAGYRIAPPNESEWDMSVASNRQILKEQILRVGINQVVQVIWKISIGSIKQISSSGGDSKLYWIES